MRKDKSNTTKKKNYLDKNEDTEDIPFLDYFVDCLDPNYQSLELADDFCIIPLTEYLSSDVEVVRTNERMTMGKKQCAMFGSIDTMGKEPILMFGAREVDPPKYNIIPDFTPVEKVMKYYGQLMNGEDVQCPYIPVANPSIPGTAREKTVQYATIDMFMHNKGAMIYYPHYMFEEKFDTNTFAIPKPDDKEGEEKHIRKNMKEQEYTFLFSAKSRIPARYYDLRVAYFAFNPTHPMAPPYIEEYQDDGRVIKGIFKWGRRLKKFRFDRKSKAYRIHSEIWYLLFGCTHYYMSMFDIEANFDIIHYLPELERLHALRKYTFAPIRLLEGMFFSSEVVGMYSPMHYYNRMTLEEKKEMERRGNQQKMYTYYCNEGIELELPGESYIDVTRDYELRFQPENKYDLSVVNKMNGMTDLRILKGEKYNKYVGNPDIFVEFSIRFKRFKVFKKGDDPDYEQRFFIYVKGAYFIGCPRNHVGSLMFHPKIVSFDRFVRETQSMTDNDEYVRSLVFCDYETVEKIYKPEVYVSYDILTGEQRTIQPDDQYEEKINIIGQLRSLVVDLDDHHRDAGVLNLKEDEEDKD